MGLLNIHMSNKESFYEKKLEGNKLHRMHYIDMIDISDSSKRI